MKKFWLVWNASWHGLPKVLHDTYEEAEEEAKRLVKAHGGRFYVLEGVAVAEVEPAPIVVKGLATVSSVS